MDIRNDGKVFPPWMNGITQAIDYCCQNVEDAGVYCIEYPKTLDEEIRPLLNGVFNCSFGSFVHYTGYELIDASDIGELEKERISRQLKDPNSAPTISGDVSPLIVNYLKTNKIVRGKTEDGTEKIMRVTITEKAEGERELGVMIDEKPQSLVNESYRALLYSVIAANEALCGRKVLGFMIDVSRLDKNSTDFVCNLFSHIHQEIVDKEGFIIFLFSESQEPDSMHFSNGYLWTDSIFNNFATISINGARKLCSFKESISAFEEISTHIKSENVLSLQIGAGASINSKLPTTGHMMKLALQELLDESEDDLDSLITTFCAVHSHETYVKELEEVTLELIMSVLKNKKNLPDTKVLKDFENRMKKAKPSSGYLLLTELSKKYKTIIFTTNFDKLSEESLEGNKVVLMTEDDYRDATLNGTLSESKHVVAKMHGDVVDTPNNLGILLDTNKELLNGIGDFYELFLKGNHLSTSTLKVLFIGYGFGDKDVLKVLKEQDNGQRKYTPYIITPTGGKKIEEFLQNLKPHSDSPRQINMSFDKFMEHLANYLV